MYTTRPNLLLGFHGCGKEEQGNLLESQSYFKKSKNSYDWLGHGMYFWENNQARAKNWAKLKEKSGSIKEPAVIGGVFKTKWPTDSPRKFIMNRKDNILSFKST